MKLLQAVRNAAQRVSCDLEDSKLFSHSGEKGQFREQIVSKFLRPFLPECYGIGTGQVFSQDGQESRQIDLVIYDAIFSNVLFRDAQASLFPCESVYGVVEVKSSLSKDELQKSVENIASLKNLPREASHMLDILPFRSIKLGRGLTFNRNKRNPYLGFVFAYESVSPELIQESLNQELVRNLANKDKLPDFIFSHKQGFMILKCLADRPAKMGEDFDNFRFIRCGTDTLPLFFVTLTVTLNQSILKAPDFDAYWINLVRESQKTKSA